MTTPVQLNRRLSEKEHNFMEPIITFGIYVKGFSEWYKEHFNEVKEQFTKEVEELFDTLEDFAVEVYMTIRLSA